MKNITLYPWQEEALTTLKEHEFQGVVKVPSGKGKTILGLACIETLDKPALVVVPTIQLAHQWKERIQEHLEEKSVSLFYGEEKDETGDIVISVINTAATQPFTKTFSLKILDEIHHYGAQEYQAVFDISTEHTIGLSATPERNDQGDLAIRYGAGSIVYSLHNLEELRERFSLCTILVPFTQQEMSSYQQLERDYRQLLIAGNLDPGQVTYQAKRKSKYALAILKKWSEMKKLRHLAQEKIPIILQLLQAEQEKKIIVFSESIEFCEKLSKKLEQSFVVHSNKTKKQNLETLEAFRKAERGVLISPRMIDEGYDVPDATVSIVASFTRKARQMIQRDGRLLRQDQPVRRYTLVLEDVEEEKFARILQETELQELASEGEFLLWRKGFVQGGQARIKFEELMNHAQGKKEWLIQRLDFFTRTRQIDQQFYQRHKTTIQDLQEEHPGRWPILEKTTPPQERNEYHIEPTHTYSFEEGQTLKNTLRKMNARLFLPQGMFQAFFRYIEGETFSLTREDATSFQRLVDEPNYNVWDETLVEVAKRILQDKVL